jgi:signal recognition particle subunit SRP14
MLVEQDSFLNQLMKLYDRTRDKGTVYITMKRYTGVLTRKSRKAAAVDEATSGEIPESKLLVRAVAGKTKYSTLVPAKDHARFSTSLMNISKVKMDSLKRKAKIKTSKA